MKRVPGALIGTPLLDVAERLQPLALLLVDRHPDRLARRRDAEPAREPRPTVLLEIRRNVGARRGEVGLLAEVRCVVVELAVAGMEPDELHSAALDGDLLRLAVALPPREDHLAVVGAGGGIGGGLPH